MTCHSCQWCINSLFVEANLETYLSKQKMLSSTGEIPNDADTAWCDQAYMDLQSCFECVVTYHNVVKEYFSNETTPKRFCTLDAVHMLDLCRLKASLTEGLTDIDKSHLLTPLKEILKFPRFLLNVELSDLFVQRFSQLSQEGNGLDKTDIEEENGILPGLYLLLIHPDKTIQRWAMETVVLLEPIDCISFDEVEEVIGLVLGVVKPNKVVDQHNVLPDDMFPWKSPKEYWIGVCMLLKSMDKKCIKARLLSSTSPHRLFVDDVLAVLEPSVSSQNGPEYIDCADFWPALQIVSLLLDYLGVYFWQSTSEKPSRICKIIVGHVEFIQQLQSLAEQREVMEENDECVLTNSQYAYNTSCVRGETSLIQRCQPSSSSHLGVGKEFSREDLVLSWVLPFVTSIISFGDNVCNPVLRQILAALNAILSTSVARNPRVKPCHLLGLYRQPTKYRMTMFTVKRKLTNMTLVMIAQVIKVLFDRARFDFLRSEKTEWLPIFSAASNAFVSMLSKSQSDDLLVFSDKDYSGLETVCDVLLSIVDCPAGQVLPCHSKFFVIFSPKMRQKLFRQSMVDFIPPFPPPELIQEFVLTVLDVLIQQSQIVDKPVAAESLTKRNPPPQFTPPNQTFQNVARKDERVQMPRKKRSLSLKRKRKLQYDSYSIMDTSLVMEKQADSEEETKQSIKPEPTLQADALSTPSNTKQEETSGFRLDLDEISQSSADCDIRVVADSGDCEVVVDASKSLKQEPIPNRRKRKRPRKRRDVIVISSDDSDNERHLKKSSRSFHSFLETRSSAVKEEPPSSCDLYPIQGTTVSNDPPTTGWVSTGLESINQLSDFVNGNSDSPPSSSAHFPPDHKVPSRNSHSSESNNQLSTPCKLQHVHVNLSDSDMSLDDSDCPITAISDPDVSSSEITRKACLYNKTFRLPSCASEGNQIVTQPYVRPIPMSISVKKMTPDNINTVKKRCKQGNLKVYSPYTKNSKECEEFLRCLGDKENELVVSLPIPKDPVLQTGKKKSHGNNNSDRKSSGRKMSINLMDRFLNESDLSFSDSDSTTKAYPDSSSCDTHLVADRSRDCNSNYEIESSMASCGVRSLDKRENEPAVSLSKGMDSRTGNEESNDSDSTTKTYPDSSSLSIDTHQVAEKSLISGIQRDCDSNNDVECTKPSTRNCGVTVRPRFSQSRMKHLTENIDSVKEPSKNSKSVSFLPETVHSCIPTTNVTRTSSTSSDTSSTHGQLLTSILKRTTSVPSSVTTNVTRTSSTSSDTSSTHGQTLTSILKRTTCTSVPSSVFQRSKPPPNLFAEILKWPLDKFDDFNSSSRLLKHLPSIIPTVFKDLNQYNNVFFNVLLVKLQRDIIDNLKHLSPDNRMPMTLCVPPMLGSPLKCQYIVSSDEYRNFNDLLAKIEFISSSSDQALEAIPPRFGIVTVSKVIGNLNNETGTITFDLRIQLDTSDLIQTNATEIMVSPILNLGMFIRQWSGISNVSKSRLLDNILSPKGGRYFGLSPLESNIEKGDHLHGQVLDRWQELAVKTAVELVTEQYIHPRIYLLEGAPGTGKTHTIANMIPAMLKSLKQPRDGVSSLPGGRSQNHRPPRILVCAPTDFGADEIVRRMIRGRLVCDSKKGKELQSSSLTDGIKIVCLGDHRKFASDVSHLSLELLIKKAQANYPEQVRYSVRDQLVKMTVEVESHESTIKNLRSKLHQYTLVEDDTVPAYLRHPNEKELNERITDEIGLKNEKEEKLKTLKQTEQTHHKLNEQNKKRLLLGADVICSTLITTGRPEFRKNYFKDPLHFNCIIIDEASYCTEVDTLIPIAYRPTKLILVGDPIGEHRYVHKRSGAADSCCHGRSMFERMRSVLKTEGFPLHSLQIQYRMNPLLFEFPLTNFYPGALITSSNKTTKFTNNDGLVPFKIFDIQYGMDAKHGSNEKEAQIVVKIVENLMGECIIQQEIGIITPYPSQERLIRSSLNKKLRCKRIEIGRTDVFQGKEKTAVVLSCVKTNETTPPLGFLSDPQKMNIALTRSREILYIVAKCDSLKFNDNWNRLIAHAKATGTYTICNICDDIKDRLRHNGPAVSNSREISSLENIHSVANTLDIDESSQDMPTSNTHPHTSCTLSIERNITTMSDEMENCTVNDSPHNDTYYDPHDPVCYWPDDSQVNKQPQPSEQLIDDNPSIVQPRGRLSSHGGPKKRKAHASTEEIELVMQLAPVFREILH